MYKKIFILACAATFSWNGMIVFDFTNDSTLSPEQLESSKASHLKLVKDMVDDYPEFAESQYEQKHQLRKLSSSESSCAEEMTEKSSNLDDSVKNMIREFYSDLEEKTSEIKNMNLSHDEESDAIMIGTIEILNKYYYPRIRINYPGI